MPGSSRVAAQMSPSVRSTSLPTEAKPAKCTPRALPRERNVPIMPPECDPAKMRPTGRSARPRTARTAPWRGPASCWRHSLGGIGLARRALVEPALEDVLGDAVLHDLDRAA